MWFKRKKKPPSLSIADNFPALYKEKKRETILSDPISSISTAITLFLSNVVTSAAVGLGIAAPGTVIVVSAGTVFKMALLAGAALMSLSASSKSKKPTAMNTNGIQVNGRLATDKKRISYGDFCSGGTWVFFDTTSADSNNLNNLFHVVIDWGEGEQAIAKDLEQPFFSGNGQDGLITNGIYTGADYNKYVVKMEG